MDYEGMAKRAIEVANILYEKNDPIQWDAMSAIERENLKELLAITKAAIEEETGETPTKHKIILSTLSYLEYKYDGWIFKQKE